MALGEWEFQRLPTEEELIRSDKPIVALFSDPHDEPVWLSAQEITSHRLTDVMREGMLQTPVVEPEPEPEPEHIPSDDMLGGHSNDWRWQRVVEIRGQVPGEGCKNHGASQTCDECVVVLWAIDNKPALERWRESDRTDPAPEFQHVVLPGYLLKVIAAL